MSKDPIVKGESKTKYVFKCLKSKYFIVKKSKEKGILCWSKFLKYQNIEVSQYQEVKNKKRLSEYEGVKKPKYQNSS